MLKASTKEEFDRKQAFIAEQEAKRRAPQSSMPPRSEWKSDAKPVTFQDAYAPSRPTPKPQTKRSFEESMALSIGLPPGDRLREQAKQEFFGVLQTEQDRIADLSAKIAELEKRLQ